MSLHYDYEIPKYTHARTLNCQADDEFGVHNFATLRLGNSRQCRTLSRQRGVGADQPGA